METLVTKENLTQEQNDLFGYYIDGLNKTLAEYNRHNEDKIDALPNIYSQGLTQDFFINRINPQFRLMTYSMHNADFRNIYNDGIRDRTFIAYDVLYKICFFQSQIDKQLKMFVENDVQFDEDIIRDYEKEFKDDVIADSIYSLLERNEFTSGVCQHLNINRDTILHTIYRFKNKEPAEPLEALKHSVVCDLLVCNYIGLNNPTAKAEKVNIAQETLVRFYGFGEIIDIKDEMNKIREAFSTRERKKARLKELAKRRFTDAYVLREKTADWETPSKNLTYSINIPVYKEMPSEDAIDNPLKVQSLFGKLPKSLYRIFSAVDNFQGNPDEVEILLNINNKENLKYNGKPGILENQRAIDLVNRLKGTKNFDNQDELNNFIEESINSFDWLQQQDFNFKEVYYDLNPEDVEEKKRVYEKSLNNTRALYKNLFLKAYDLQRKGMQINYTDCTDGMYIANADRRFLQRFFNPKVNINNGQGPRRRLLSLASQERFRYARRKSDHKIRSNQQLILNLDCDNKVSPEWLNEQVRYQSKYSKGPTLLLQPHLIISEYNNIVDHSISTMSAKVELYTRDLLQLSRQIYRKEHNYPGVGAWPGTYVVNASADRLINGWNYELDEGEDTDYLQRLDNLGVKLVIESKATVSQIDRMRPDSYFGNRSNSYRRDNAKLVLDHRTSENKSIGEEYLKNVFRNDSEIVHSWENLPLKIYKDIYYNPITPEENELIESIFNPDMNKDSKWREYLAVLFTNSKDSNILVQDYIWMMNKIRTLSVAVFYNKSKSFDNIRNYFKYIGELTKGHAQSFFIPVLRQVDVTT